MDLMTGEKITYVITIRSKTGLFTDFKVDSTSHEEAIQKAVDAFEEIQEPLGLPAIQVGDILEIMSADGVGVFVLSSDGGWEPF